MKKTFMTLALVAAIALVSVNAMAWGMHGYQGNGYGMHQTTQVDTKAYQEFLDSTADLRAAISADRAEVAALMAGQNPDAKQVRTLTERINKNIATLDEKAEALGLPEHGFMERGMMHGGMMHGGMMGFNGHGNGYNCPAW
ncbi:zinc resistance protein [Pseudodesulfovibrio cashew]|uniref:Zinc resistance protein n=1 Tax=Pseudodesulfovibrio cashew TaxID=2678688 RepID=A0A6I6JUQ4_9BACT|nr:periplasmic heavy metal sensor [Pseudodesulfovibrio cashew]QGY41444.1 zinc resistance protein [Pseudodesulfovibrio cashew]